MSTTTKQRSHEWVEGKVAELMQARLRGNGRVAAQVLKDMHDARVEVVETSDGVKWYADGFIPKLV